MRMNTMMVNNCCNNDYIATIQGNFKGVHEQLQQVMDNVILYA